MQYKGHMQCPGASKKLHPPGAGLPAFFIISCSPYRMHLSGVWSTGTVADCLLYTWSRGSNVI